MRNSTFRAITASVAAVAMILSVGTSPVLARGGGGHAGAGGGFHAGGGSTRAGIRTPTATAAVTTVAVTTAAPVRQTQFRC
jgi:hypothetical protein